VHKISVLLLSILLIILTGCEDKKQDNHNILVENTTQVLKQNKTDTRDHSSFKVQKTHPVTKQSIITKTAPIKNIKGTFTLSNQSNEQYTVTLDNQKIKLSKLQEPIVIIHIFNTWCKPCIAEISYLNDLQSKYKKELFIASVLSYDTVNTKYLNDFMQNHKINYYLSNSVQNDAFTTLLARTLSLPKNFSIPLSVMYVDGKYFTHYEGLAPIEMIEYDIEQAKKYLNKNS